MHVGIDQPGQQHRVGEPVVDNVLVGVQPRPEGFERPDLEYPVAAHGHCCGGGQRRIHRVDPSRRIDGDHQWFPFP